MSAAAGPLAEAAVQRWLRGLAPDLLATLGRQYAAALAADGLAVHRPGEASEWVAIPPLLTPKVITRARLDAMGDDAHRLAAALVKLAGRVASGPDPEQRALGVRLFATLTPLEQSCLSSGDLGRLATVRVDYFLDRQGRHRALELNATIPAMQGYSDMIARRFLELCAEHHAGGSDGVAGRGGVARLKGDQALSAALTENGSNTDDLLASLLEHGARLGLPLDRRAPLHIAIVCRRGDAQLGELRHYQRVWAAHGHDAVQVFADEVRLDGDGHATARGRRIDLLYRHIFARRVEPGSDLERILGDPTRHRVLNPVNSPLEVKGMLALLSEVAGDDARAVAAGLSEGERETARETVPWTRILRATPGVGIDGEAAADLAAYVRANPGRLVLKRSWDYGGKSVFLGPDVAAGDTQRLAALVGTRPATWSGLVDFALADHDLWVAQELIEPVAEPHLVADRDAAPAWRELYVDVSAYANLGVRMRPRGGACRASASRIVNILGGGGLSPTVSAEALAHVLPENA